MDTHDPKHVRTYDCRFTAERPLMHGRPEGQAWDSASWTAPFVDIADGPTPRFETRAKMLWDGERLYIGARMEEPQVWATYERHDSVIFEENDFEVFIDPDWDRHQYLELEVNAIGTSWDLLLPRPYRDGGTAMNAFEISGMELQIAIDASQPDRIGAPNDPANPTSAWWLTLSIPFETLAQIGARKGGPQAGDSWRINFSRVEWQIAIDGSKIVKVPGKPEDNWVWSSQGVIDMHRPERWGVLRFCDAEGGGGAATDELDSRWRLQLAHEMQREFGASHSRWARDWRELGRQVEGVTLDATRFGFELWTEVQGGVLRMTEDGRVLRASR